MTLLIIELRHESSSDVTSFLTDEKIRKDHPFVSLSGVAVVTVDVFFRSNVIY